MKKIIIKINTVLLLLAAPSLLWAANPEPVSVNVTFVNAITIDEVNPLSFGLIDASMASNDTITIAPDDTITDSNDKSLGGAQEAAEVNVTASSGQSITISIDNINSGTHYTLNNPTCKYDNNAASNCDSLTTTSVGSGTLLIGMTLTRNTTTMTAGDDNGSFEVNVSYN